ncbi:MAG: serine protease [Candidatus Nanoarchaeia archaeon]|nr:serine protease [Candidatus Nanoarchaeia archaeon]
MGERLRRLKKGAIASLAAIAMSSGIGFAVPSDYNKTAEEARQAYVYEHQDIDGLYDYDSECIPNLENILNEIKESTYEINNFVFYTVEGGIYAGSNMRIAGGSGILLDSGYIISAGHVIKNDLEDMVRSTGGIITDYKSSFFLAEEGKYHALEAVWTGSDEDDFTILGMENPEPSLHSASIRFGSAEYLANGSITYTFSAMNEPWIKEGHVFNAERGIWNRDARDYGYFLEDTYVTHGDSGGPVIAFRDGTPELIGITCYYAHTRCGQMLVRESGILKIDVILEHAGDILMPSTISAY